METKLLFNNSRGDQLVGILNKKSSKDIVILCHGFTSDKNSAKNIEITKRLNDVSTFRFDFYAHGESDGALENITVSEGIDDILSAINYLKKLKYKNIGLLGSSYGGLCSIMAAAKAVKTDDIQYLILVAPVSDWEDAKRKSQGEQYLIDWQNKGYAYYQKADGNKIKLGLSLYKDFKNNIAYIIADKIKIPVLLAHGTEDRSVPFQQSSKLFKLLQCDKQFVKITGGDHRFSDPNDLEQLIKVIIDFINNQVHGIVDK
ncbi:alpha/beta fold hydrolase [Candidatus Woesearchaeota archaeon]|nr:alpha/beta fold hydrolase [Candidatus Woesearchaeota archaeon]